MCFDLDSRPPIEPIAGGSLDHEDLVLTAADGNRFAAFRARAARRSGAGIVILPDVRGLHPYYEELALRFAETGTDAIAIDYFGRTAGAAKRDGDFEYMPHVGQTRIEGLQADVAAAVETLRADGRVRALFATGFCFGGRLAFLDSDLRSRPGRSDRLLRLAGRLRDRPRPRRSTSRTGCGADPGHLRRRRRRDRSGRAWPSSRPP